MDILLSFGLQSHPPDTHTTNVLSPKPHVLSRSHEVLGPGCAAEDEGGKGAGSRRTARESPATTGWHAWLGAWELSEGSERIWGQGWAWVL